MKLAAADSLASAAERFSALLAEVDDPSRPAIGTWSVADTAAHVAFVLEHLPRYLDGSEIIPGRAENFARLADAHTTANAAALLSQPERELSTLATQVRAGAERLIETAAGLGAEPRQQWFGSVDVSVDFYLAVAINELLVHGLDIARAARRPWPVDRPTAAFIVEAFLPVAPYYVDRDAARGLNARYELRIRGGPTAYLTFDDGALSVTTERDGRVDCRISADPWWYLLLAYRRAGQWSAALRGKIRASGRRPWLGLKLGRLAATP